MYVCMYVCVYMYMYIIKCLFTNTARRYRSTGQKMPSIWPKKKNYIVANLFIFYFRIMSEITHFRILKLSFMCWQYDLSWEKWFWTWECKTEAFSLVISDPIVCFLSESQFTVCWNNVVLFLCLMHLCSSCLTGGQAAGVLPGHPEMGQTVLLSLPVASARSVRETGM